MLFSQYSISETEKQFSTHKENGLSLKKFQEHKKKYGKNTLPQKRKSRIKMLLAQFSSPLIVVLLGAVSISTALPFLQTGEITGHDLIEPIAIFSILVLNALFGFFQETKAENTLQALKQMQPDLCTVRRNGKTLEASAEDIVPGDLLLLAEGDKIPADARLCESANLGIIESALTGESLPSHKESDWVGKGGIGDQKNMVFSGTMVATGRGEAIVVATGMNTEIGHIARMVSETETPPTPLEKRLQKLGKRISLAVLGICFFIFGLSIFQEQEFTEALIVAVALAVSAIPEGLPAVMTISLALGVGVMAKKKALIRELKAVEALGSITCIASDKTGTITQNKMTVMRVYANGEFFTEKELKKYAKTKDAKMLLNVAASCNDSELPNIGDPTELALLQFAHNNKVQRKERVDEVPFSSETKWMSTTHIIKGKKQEFIKGAPEVVGGFCTKKAQKEISEAAIHMAEKGLRTIAIAVREGRKKAEFIGIIGLLDPPRKTAKIAIKKAQSAGIRTVMITGDHAVTAQAIAHRVGLSGEALSGAEIEEMKDTELQESVKNTNIFARVSPEHKVRICKALQKNGHIVAMTGDGVNDAPAIHRAEVGISMGKVGTSVARQASDLILLDDHYATIVKGVEEGRRIFENIKKSVVFLLRTNFGEVLLITATTMAALPLPMLPIHILFLNLVTDSLPALALAAEDAERGIMKKAPRPTEEGFLHKQLSSIAILGAGMAITSLCIFIFAKNYLPLEQVQTLVLTSVIAIEFSVIFSIRSTQRVFGKKRKDIPRNPWILRSVIVGTGLYLICLFTPLSNILSLHLFPAVYWLFPLASGIFLFLLSEALKKK